MDTVRLVALVVVSSLTVLGTVGPVSAHESTTVEGYELTFGGSDEPVITGERMWLQVEVVDAETGVPVEDLADSVELAVQRPFGNDTFALDVHGVHGRPGWYEGAVVFTEPGTYTVFVAAETDGTTIQTSFQKQVHNASTLAYPRPTPSPTSGTSVGASTGFGLGVFVAAVSMVGAFVIGRRTQP